MLYAITLLVCSTLSLTAAEHIPAKTTVTHPWKNGEEISPFYAIQLGFAKEVQDFFNPNNIACIDPTTKRSAIETAADFATFAGRITETREESPGSSFTYDLWIYEYPSAILTILEHLIAQNPPAEQCENAAKLLETQRKEEKWAPPRSDTRIINKESIQQVEQLHNALTQLAQQTPQA